VEVVDKKCHNRLRLVTIYGLAQVEKKEMFLIELSTIFAKCDLPLIVGGDFNILRFSDEKNKPFCANRYSQMFNWIINSYGLREIALVGGKFTWSNNHDLPTLEKLDRVLMNDKWEGLFPLTTLRKRPRLMSDHNPLLLCTGQDQKKKAKNFSFETSWPKQEDFICEVKEIWTKSVVTKDAIEKWYIKLNRIKKFLKRWGDSLKGHTKKHRISLQSELAELEALQEEDSLPTRLLDRKPAIQAEMMKLNEQEEIYWHQRSNENWLLKGDSNTDYFHKKANGKKRKNTIFHLEKDGGVIENEKEILNHATEYYKELFGPSESPVFSLDPECWGADAKINEDENLFLTRPFTEEEIRGGSENNEEKYSARTKPYACRVLSSLLGIY
jgi:hypothetical protein